MRLALPFLFLFAAVVTVWAVFQLMPASVEGAATVSVEVIHPDGGVWFAGNVTVAPASVLVALHVLAEAQEVAVVQTEHAGFGACGAFIESIGGYGPDGAEGWVYDVWHHEDGDWVPGAVGAGCAQLEDGDRVRWRYGTE